MANLAHHKRMFNGDRAWQSSKIAQLEPDSYRAEYAWLYPLAMADGSFEAEPRKVWSLAYSHARTGWTVKKVGGLLIKLQEVGLLRLKISPDGKLWGYWTGSEQDLPSPSERAKYGLGKGYMFEVGSRIGVEYTLTQESLKTDFKNGLAGFGLGRDGVVGEGMESGPATSPPNLPDQEKKEPAPTGNVPQQAMNEASKGDVAGVIVPEGRQPEKIFNCLVQIWGKAYPNTACRTLKGRGWEWWSDECSATPPKTMALAFTNWVAEKYPNDDKNEDPVGTFLRQIKKWRLIVVTMESEGKQQDLNQIFLAMRARVHGTLERVEQVKNETQSAVEEEYRRKHAAHFLTDHKRAELPAEEKVDLSQLL
jgi:hypothetical protein